MEICRLNTNTTEYFTYKFQGTL